MDILNDFKKAGSTAKETKEVIYDLYNQKSEIERKVHLFTVLAFSREMNQFIEEQQVSTCNVSSINLRHYRDHESGCHNLLFDLLNLQHKEIEHSLMDEKQNQIWCKIMEMLSSNGLISVDNLLVNQSFIEDKNKKMSISLLKNTENDILEIFLNNDLKKILQFHLMQNDLPSNNESGKKLKV
jgi:hypothetical protein